MRQVMTVNTIELSSICDNRCQYCPAKKQHEHRPVGFMTWDTFEKAMDWVSRMVEQGTQRELNLFGVGEATLNPMVVDAVEYARDLMPMDLPVHLNTNGNTLTEELARKLKDAGISAMDVTAHDHYHAVRAFRILRAVGIPTRLVHDFVTQPNDWAGQVDWFAPEYRYECPWLHRGQVMVMSDGRVTRCCIDAFARGVYCSVEDDPDSVEVAPFGLCRTCHQTVPEDMKKELEEVRHAALQER